MATKSSKTKVTLAERTIASDLNPRDPDLKYTGPEPIFAHQPDHDRRKLALVMAFNWYGRFYGNSDALSYLADYADSRGNELAKQVRRSNEREITPSLGWLARLYLRGLDLSPVEHEALNNEIVRLTKIQHSPEVVETAKPQEKSNRPNVQEIMRERAREAAGEIEGWFDDFVISGAKTNKTDVNPIGILTEKNILPQHISILTEVWRARIKEFDLVLSGKDVQLTEAYSRFTKTQIKTMIKFCETVIAGLQGYVTVKKSNSAPRKKRVVSPEKQVSKVKYLKAFDELKLASVSATKLLGATEIWLYDTSKRKLHYYVADGHIGTMGIKGTTIVGFDATKSGVKTLRKPQDVLKKLMAAGKPASRKVFGDVNAVQAQPNGRTNEHMIILKCY